MQGWPPPPPTQSALPSLQPLNRCCVIRVYDAAGDVIETHEHKGDFKEW